MGVDSKLWHKKSNNKISCDRLYNLKNDYTEAKGLLDYLMNQGIPKYMLVDLCNGLNAINNINAIDNKHLTIYEQIIEGLKPFEDEDIFVLIDDNNSNY